MIEPAVLAEAIELAGARFGPPRGESEVAALERRIRVRLPEDYRHCLAEIGTSCPDGPPHYGLASPWDPTMDLGEPADPARPFPLTEMWIWEGDADEAREESVWEHGWVWLGTDGCGMHWVLVTAGAAAGQVWQLTEMGAVPYRGGTSFSEWLWDWLTGGPLWVWGSGTEDWLAACQRPVARVERSASVVRVWLRDPHDARAEPKTCGWIEHPAGAAGTPVGEWTEAVGAYGRPLAMTPTGARLLWDRLVAEAL